ncbi:hypothetical protein J2S00_002760 [Caldalkalibacillus uzonensis]|uniref:Uncharacterized protein n=1 Tax=Caldalkalibacillus uzonensis TaxID=353224 RepID=A0ABU0CUD8_9BACI|nr:hypothetical protein [Caldalkalibacillus uzonensis]MDQ0339965.1 hypothetical protein [Caldalkalibacillus uzonensis]
MTFGIFISLIGFPIAVLIVTFLCYWDIERKYKEQNKSGLERGPVSSEEGGISS